MKTMKAIVLTAIIVVCGVWFAVSATETKNEKNAGTTTAVACDTTKCQFRSCHVGGMQACASHKGMKCEKACSAKCKDMHAKGTCPGHTPEKCTK
jgi:hypothetical protein